MTKIWDTFLEDVPRALFLCIVAVVLSYLIFITVFRTVPTQIMGQFWGGTNVLLNDVRAFPHEILSKRQDREECISDVDTALSNSGWHVTRFDRITVGRQRANKDGVQRALAIECRRAETGNAVRILVTGFDFDGSLDHDLPRILDQLR